MEPSEAGGVWVSTGTIYDKLLEVERKVDAMAGQDLPARIRSLEIRQWAIPANTLVALAGIATAILRT